MRNDSRKAAGPFRRLLLAAVLCMTMLPLEMSAQRISLTLKDVTVQEAVTALNQSSNYSVILNADEVDLGRRISVSARDAAIEDVLSQIFAGQDVSYAVEGNRISVAGKLADRSSASSRNGKVVKGVVRDAAGEPLMGAGVVVKGTSDGCITDIDGNFTLSGVSYPLTLVVSFIGLAETEVTLASASDSPVAVTLQETGISSKRWWSSVTALRKKSI